MRYLILSFVFLLVFSSFLLSEEISMNQLQGEWINKSYLESLHRTRSHYKAMFEKDINKVPAFYISQEDSIYRWSIALGFHEGMGYNISDLNPCSDPNTYELVFHVHQDCGRISEHDRFFLLDGITGNEIVWNFNPLYLSMKGEQKISYVRLKPPLVDYINYVLLVGTYSDQNGNTFTFHHSGKAKWPNKSFSYKVSLDTFLSILSSCDYFFVIGERNREGDRLCYPFKWLNNKLYIYDTYYDPPGTDSLQPKKEPMYILTPK